MTAVNPDSRCLMLTARGRTMSLIEWCRETGIAKSTVQHRLKDGWDVEDALFTPPKKTRKVTGLIEIDGETMTLRQWCSRYGCCDSTVRRNHDRFGMTWKEALEHELRSSGRRKAHTEEVEE